MSHHMFFNLPLLTRPLWLHIWFRLARCAFIGPYFFVTHIADATTNASACIQKCMNKYIHTQQQMHRILFCEDRILFNVITLNRTVHSYICCFLFLQTYFLHIDLHLLRICLRFFQHSRFCQYICKHIRKTL